MATKHLAVFMLLIAFVSSADAADKVKELPPRDIERLAWLAGAWSARTSNGGSTEEHWIAPKGGVMLGVNRTVRPGRRSSFEFLRIEATRTGIVYYASPGGRAPTPFELTKLKESQAVFSNPKHDFPQTITYRRDGKTLHVKIAGQINGRSKSLAWKWQISTKD